MAQITIIIGSRMAAFAVVAEMNAESTRLIMMKLNITPPALLPNFSTNQSAKRLAAWVFTSIEARTKERMFSHITGWPSWAYAVLSVVMLVRTIASITISDVR